MGRGSCRARLAWLKYAPERRGIPPSGHRENSVFDCRSRPRRAHVADGGGLAGRQAMIRSRPGPKAKRDPEQSTPD
jgi:hypothetical protein